MEEFAPVLAVGAGLADATAGVAGLAGAGDQSGQSKAANIGSIASTAIDFIPGGEMFETGSKVVKGGLSMVGGLFGKKKK